MVINAYWTDNQGLDKDYERLGQTDSDMTHNDWIQDLESQSE